MDIFGTGDYVFDAIVYIGLAIGLGILLGRAMRDDNDDNYPPAA